MPVQFASLDPVERRTGDDVITMDLADDMGIVSYTPVYLPAIPDNNLRHVMERWNYSLPSPYFHPNTANFITAAHRLLWAVGSERQSWPSVAWISPSEEATNPSEELDSSELTAEQAISRVMGILDLSKRDVLAAAGVAPTTYYYWKRSAKRSPRLTSTGRAWSLLEAVDDLREILGRSLNSWLAESVERRKDFRAGRFDKLTAEALAESPSQDKTIMRVGPSESVGIEDVGPRVAEAKTLQGRIVGGSGTIMHRGA